MIFRSPGGSRGREKGAPSMPGSSHRARRHRRTQLQRSRPFLILNVPSKKRNNFFATTITRGPLLDRMSCWRKIGDSAPAWRSFGPWITTSLYANRPGAVTIFAERYIISASPRGILSCVCIDAPQRKTSTHQWHRRRGENRRCRRASDNFLMEPLPVVCPFDRAVETYLHCVIWRGRLEKLLLGIILFSRNISPLVMDIYPPRGNISSSYPGHIRTRHAIHIAYSPPQSHGGWGDEMETRCESTGVSRRRWRRHCRGSFHRCVTGVRDAA